jgi:uracil DNA glycosylase
MKMSKQLESAVNIWHDIAKTLNTIVEEDGEIRIDDKRIWNGYLHQWTNEEWLLLVEAVYTLHEIRPDLFKPYHKEALTNTIITLSNGSKNSRIMDKRANKAQAWRMIMTLREVWNRACDINLPNQPSATSKLKPKTQFNQLFKFTGSTQCQLH